MAPFIKSDDIVSAEPIQPVDPPRQEIFYNGYLYDVTDFIKRHPGGSIIRFYTEPGEDATQPIEQFHFRSKDKVESMMKSFKRRPAKLSDLSSEPKLESRHEALSADFKQLFTELKNEGYFEPSIKIVIVRLTEVIGFMLLSMGLFLHSTSVFTRFVSTILVGFALSRSGWVQHEGGHNSLTGYPKIDKFLQILCFPGVIGGSAAWWNSQHNRHHAMPQRLEHDVDLATLPYVAFNARTVKDRNQINKFFVRFQGVFYWTLDLFLITVIWRLVLHPRYSLKKKAYFEMLIGIPNLLISVYFIGPHWYMMMAYWFTFFLGVNFALSHTHLDVADKPTHWIEYAFNYTVNVTPNLFVDYYMGYLNYQIEHHLFPSMPEFRHPEISHRVKALAEKHCLPYRVMSYREALKVTFSNLHKVGQEITSNDFFEKKENQD